MALYSSVLQMYLNWANSLLCERGVLVSDVQELQDGRIFTLLIDVLNGDEITFTETEDDEETNLQRIQSVLTYLQQQEVSLKTSAKDVLRGDMKSILDILWALILHFTIHSNETPSSRRTLRNGRLTLMEWCHDQLPAETFKMHWSIIDNFRESNSLAELVETCSSSEALDEERDSPVRRLTTALIAAEETLGILKSHLSPADVIHGTANEYSIVIFLALLKRKFTLLAPELSVVSTPSPDPQCHLSDHIPEPDLYFDSVGKDEAELKNFTRSNHSTEGVQSQITSSVVRQLEISHNQSEISQHRTSLTNGGNVGGHSIPVNGDARLTNSNIETFHQSITSDEFTSKSHTREVRGVPMTGIIPKTDSHLALGRCFRMNGPTKGLWEEEAETKGDKMDEKREGKIERLVVGVETVKSEMNMMDTNGIESLDDNKSSLKGQSFEDELLGLLEMIGVEGRQLRQELDSAQEREVYLLGQLQETVAGKHEEKVIARLIQELEMLRRENRSFFRELADARSELSRKTLNCDELQDRCRKLEAELLKAKSNEDLVRIRGDGSQTGSEMTSKELRDENENLVANGQSSWMSDAKTSDGLEEMMRRSAEENHKLRSELAAYGADHAQRYQKTKEALKIAEAENSDLKEKCHKFKRSLDDLKVDLDVKEKRMSRYERYLEILRQQNAKLIAHIGGKPLEGDERVDVAKMELEEIKEEYKELRKKLELAEEDRTLLSRELEQMKSGRRSLVDGDVMPSLEHGLPEFHKLPFVESPKGQKMSETVGRITSQGNNAVDTVQQVHLNSSACKVPSKDERDIKEGTNSGGETKGYYIPEVKRPTVNGRLSDTSSLKSYDVSESETAASDSDHPLEGLSVDMMMAHSRLTELRQRYGLQKGVRSPSLGSLIRARATEGKSNTGGGESEGLEESGQETSLHSDEEIFQTPGEERISSATLPSRPVGIVRGGMDVNTSLFQEKKFIPAKLDNDTDGSVYYTPNDNWQRGANMKLEARYCSARSSSLVKSQCSQSRLLGTSSTRLATSGSHSDSNIDQESGLRVDLWNSKGNTSKTVTSDANVYTGSQRSQHLTNLGQHGSTPGSSSSRVPKWRQLRYSRARSLHDSKSGTLNASGKIGDARLSFGTPGRGRVSASSEYPPVDTNSRYTDESTKKPPQSLNAKTSLNIPDHNDDEFQPLPDQLMEPKKLADVTPPRNQRSPPATNRLESAVKMRLSFEDTDTMDCNTKQRSTQSERISTSNDNQLHSLKEPDGAINCRSYINHGQVRRENFDVTRLKSEASNRSITTSLKSRSTTVDDFHPGGVQSGDSGVLTVDAERNSADAVAARVILQADSGISLASIGCDGSLAERNPGYLYIHKMLSTADQSYANSIIDKYLSKT